MFENKREKKGLLIHCLQLPPAPPPPPPPANFSFFTKTENYHKEKNPNIKMLNELSM